MDSQFSAKTPASHRNSPPSSSTALASSRFPSRQDRRQVIRIDALPDDVLLGIFDFYVKKDSTYALKRGIEKWQLLVHVCRRWRTLVLGSPCRLNLRLYCTPETPARGTLDVWPALPLIVRSYKTPSTSGTENIIAAFGQSNRVCQVGLVDSAGRQLEQALVAMQVPFPELTELRLVSKSETLTVIPDSFLDGSAPRLRYFDLSGIPFPGLPKLLLSATHLVYLLLSDIPHSGYISPEAIVALISALSSLESLHLRFRSPGSRPDRPDPSTRRPPRSRRSVIPALVSLHFKGVIEYLEDLVTGIDTPKLDDVKITFFNQIDFDTPRLAQFINRTPKLGKRGATVRFYDDSASVKLSPGTLLIQISCREPGWQLSSIEQVCNSLHPLSTVEVLYIDHRYRRLPWKDDAIENSQWLQLLLPFTAVKNLYLDKEFAAGIAAALQELVGRRIRVVLPSLQKIFVEDLEPSESFQEKIGRFVAMRQLLNHPITISVWYTV